MLSILIPTYHYDVSSLVKALHKQCKSCHIAFEILVFDDASKSHLNKGNETINALDYCTFRVLPNNLGRSAIRNLLATQAQYNTLLFIDAGTFPKHDNFIERYLSVKNKIKKYGYEDVLFFEKLSNQNIETHFFNNPVIHNADDDADSFINKTEYALENLADLIDFVI